MKPLQFQANHVSAESAGDYYQASFAEADDDDIDRPYLNIQRQFEDPDENSCYVETHDADYRGHFQVRRIEFTPQRLLVEPGEPSNGAISVTFDLTPKQFAATARVLKIISGEVEPEAE